jgi:hypothetical protein
MRSYSLKRLAWVGPLATLTALAADLLYFFGTRALGEQYLLPREGIALGLIPMSFLTPIPVIVTSGLVATVFFGLLIRFTHQPAVIFLSVAAAALILSFGGSFSLPSAPLQTKLLLSGMHVLAAGIITAGILLFSRKTSPEHS